MQATVAEVAQLVGGRVVGDAAHKLTGINSLGEAGPGDISFLANPKYAGLLGETKATAVLMEHESPECELIQIVVENPDYAFAQVVEHYGPQPATVAPGVHPSAVIAEDVQLGADIRIGPLVAIGPGAVIGDRCVIHAGAVIGDAARLGADCQIYSHVNIRERCEIGERVIIHSGSVIGSDGFGYATVKGVHRKIPQVGIVVVEDDVEIGANAAVDRARFGKTVIGRGTKVDNLVQIAHNVVLGQGCILAGQSGIAGSTKLGDYVTLAGQSGVVGHLEIGDQSIVTAQAGVTKSLPAQAVVRGSPAQDFRISQKQEVTVRRLPKVAAQVKALEERIQELERRLSEGDQA